MKVETDFDVWFEAQGYIEDDGCYQEKYLAARDAWEYKDAELQRVVARLERFPSCMSCYITQEEMRAGNDMKESLVRILKEELL